MVDIDEVMRQFDQLDIKIELLIDHCRTLESANLQLGKRIMELESALEQKDETEKQHSEKRQLIRSKIETLLGKLEGIRELEGSRN